MFERPRRLRRPSPATRRRRAARWIAAGRHPPGRALRAVGRADQRLLVLLRTRGHSELGERLAQGLGLFGELGAGWIGLALGGAAVRPERRGAWLAAAGAAPAGILLNYGVKRGIGRERPLIDEHPPLARAPSKLSFPSGHSTSAIAAAVVLGRIAPGARAPLYSLAASICACRPYLGMHYPSDVLAGAALGYAFGRIYPLPSAPHGDGRPDRKQGIAASPAPPQGEARGGVGDLSDAVAGQPTAVPGREAEDAAA